MSDGKDVVIAWVAGHSRARPSFQRAHRVALVQIGMDQACVKGRGGVGHEAVGTAEGTPCLTGGSWATSGEGPEKVPSHRRRARVVPGVGGWGDRHERSARVDDLSIQITYQRVRNRELGAAVGFGAR